MNPYDMGPYCLQIVFLRTRADWIADDTLLDWRGKGYNISWIVPCALSHKTDPMR